MAVLAVILARAGSKGLPLKCLRPLAGRPLIDYTFDHALASRCDAVLLSTDCTPAAQLAAARGIETIARPADLATDTATVDAAVRHAVEAWESRHNRRADIVVILYGNIPIRAVGVIDRAVAQLRTERASSVRTVAPVGKLHPDWLHKLDGARMSPFRSNRIYRRQDLEPLYYHDGAVIAVTRDALFDQACANDPRAFLGAHRAALVQDPSDAVDVDDARDLALAQALLATQRHAIQTVRIARRVVGRGCGVYVIAEAGVNHNGSLEQALALVDAALVAGADAVKFQIFSAERLAAHHAAPAAYQRAAGHPSQFEMLRTLELVDAAWQAIRDRCHTRRIDFLATPFSPADLRRLVALSPVAVKLASTDLDNFPLLDAAAASGLPLIVSTGAALEREIAEMHERLRARQADERLIILHCVSQYPTPLEHANLAALAALAERFAVPVGFSDHSVEVHTGALAVAAGACVLEKHFTLDRAAPGPDHALSLTPAELADYVRNARTAAASLGSGELGLQPGESDVRRVARKSIVAARDLPAGVVIEPCMLTCKRPGGGISPAQLERLLGRRCRRAVPRDAQLNWSMLE